MAKKGDMLYAWTNDADIKKKAELGGAVTALWKHALETKAVDAVMAVQKGTDLYDVQPILVPDAKDQRVRGDSGVVHEDIQPPGPIQQYIEDPPHRIGVGDVRRKEHAVPAPFTDLGENRFGTGCAGPVVDPDECAWTRKGQRAGTSNPPGRPGHHCRAAPPCSLLRHLTSPPSQRMEPGKTGLRRT